jgi:hypothetical protein
MTFRCTNGASTPRPGVANVRDNGLINPVSNTDSVASPVRLAVTWKYPSPDEGFLNSNTGLVCDTTTSPDKGKPPTNILDTSPNFNTIGCVKSPVSFGNAIVGDCSCITTSAKLAVTDTGM